MYDKRNSTEPQQVHSPCSTHGESTSSMLTNEVQYENRHLECRVYDMPITQRRKCKVTTKSPCSSPHKYRYSQSPLPKSKRRARTGMERTCSLSASTIPVCLPEVQGGHARTHSNTLSHSDFQLNSDEKCEINQLREHMDMYILQRHAHCSKSVTPGEILTLQDYMAVIAPVCSEMCNVVYLQVLDAKSESKDTLMAILFDLHHHFIEGKDKQYLAIAADAKLYDIIQALKHEYGEDLKWLIPTPGDWHMLKNFQVALMKPYFDMGLRQLHIPLDIQ